ncbi:MAG: hypothetical protein V1704_03810 [Candidatus Vogelbacteria bacterium]
MSKSLAIRTDDPKTRQNKISLAIRTEFGPNLSGLGVSLAYAIRLIEKHGLDKEETDAIIFARRQYGASLVNIGKWLSRGLTAGEIMRLYEARQAFSENFGDLTVSLSTIVRFANIFPGLDLEEPTNLADQLVGIFEALRPQFPFIEYPDTVLKMVLVAQQSLGCIEVGTAVEAVLDRRQWQDRNDPERRSNTKSWRSNTDEDANG